MACPHPFVEESLFPFTGGFEAGRLCSSISLLGDTRCCLPCPADHWIYPDNFVYLTRIAGYVNMVGLGFCLFMLLSFAVLPVEKTRRHYLNVCLIVATVMMELGFIIPAAARPVRCHDVITPNDMTSSMLCAWSGALVIAGGIAVTSWILVRAVSMHLQICWDVVPGRKFFWGAQVVGWGICAALVAVCLDITGVSFRFGDYCHVNHHKGLETLWGPLLGIAGISMVVQIATFVFCLHVYLRNRASEGKSDTYNSRGASSSHDSTRTQTAGTVYRRVRKVIKLQWRGLVITILVVADVVYFSIVFVYLDNQIQSSLNDVNKVLPWILCVVEARGDKNQCLALAKNIAVNEGTIVATLIMLAVVGVEVWLLIGRWGMITGWVDLFRKEQRPHDFVTLESGTFSNSKRTYELLKVATPATTPISSPQTITSPDSIVKSPLPALTSPPSVPTSNMVQVNKESSREYQRPRMSFSSPRAPVNSRIVGPGWDATSSFAPSQSISTVGQGVHKPFSSNDHTGWI